MPRPPPPWLTRRETDNPPFVRPKHQSGFTVSKATLDALAKRGLLLRECVDVHRISGQRIAARFGRSWRKGSTVFTYRYHLQ